MDAPEPKAIICDLGGSWIRFAFETDDFDSPLRFKEPVNTIAASAKSDAIKNRKEKFSSFVYALSLFLDRCGISKKETRNYELWLSIPCDVTGPNCIPENLPESWIIDTDNIQKEFGFRKIYAMNDFIAIAWAIPPLIHDRRLEPIGIPYPSQKGGRIAIIGAGTALGAALLARDSHGFYIPIASEFGHTEPRSTHEIDDLLTEIKALAELQVSQKQSIRRSGNAEEREEASADLEKVTRRYGLDGNHKFPYGRYYRREYLTSGPGIERLYDGVFRKRGLDKQYPPRIHPIARNIVEDACKDGPNSDSLASYTIKKFCEILGRDAADLATTLTARGGVIVVGPVARALGAKNLFDFGFRKHFENETERKDGFPANVPTFLLQHDNPGLFGLARLARTSLPAESNNA